MTKFSSYCFLEIAVPGKVLYLDCFILGAETFQLSWGLPLVSNDGEASAEASSEISSMGVIDPTVTHAVIQYRDQGHICKVEAKTSPYTFTGACKLYVDL